MKAADIKQLTGAKTKREGVAILYERLQGRRWERNGRVYNLAGYDSRKDLVHFTATWSIPGGAGHSRVGTPLFDAVSSKTGNLSAAIVLH